ncbi:hypothetical protein FPV67DRAFT_1390566, partial [Lyophyllum atratum]
INEVLSFVFSGPCAPTQEDFARTSMLVHREKIKLTLDWLILNHDGYEDVEISRHNLAELPECGIPVTVDYKHVPIEDSSTLLPSTQSKHDSGEEPGTESGACTFAVHGLTGNQYANMSIDTLKARAIHLASGGHVLGVGHDKELESMYDNPTSYPQMF